MTKKFFNNPVLYFFILVLVVVALAAVFWPGGSKPSSSAKFAQVATCGLEKFSAQLQSTSIGEIADRKLIVNFIGKPDNQTISDLANQGIILHPESWVLDFLVAQADYENICALAKLNQVTYIDIATE